MTERLWILGAPDPEMEAIERLLNSCGERVVYAKTAADERIRPGQFAAPIHVGDATTIYTVECDPPLACGEPEDEPDVGQVIRDGRRYMAARRCVELSVIRIDHHRPGDPGYGRPPSEFLAASSIGQVIVQLALAHALGRLDWAPCYHLQPYGWQSQATQSEPHFGCGHTRGRLGWIDSPAKWAVGYPAAHTDAVLIPDDLILIAAADHCLGAAYRGECPGVDPDELMRWRAESRAKFQGRTVEEVLADVERARAALAEAPEVDLTPDRPEPLHGPDTPFVPRWSLVRDLREAYTVRTVLVEPFVDGATVDAEGVGDSVTIEFGERDEGAWDEGSHHTFVRRGVPELPEAAARLGIGYVSGPLVGPDGRRKITCSGTQEQVRAFLEQWAPSQGLVNLYGDPARGFAGGYLP